MQTQALASSAYWKDFWDIAAHVGTLLGLVVAGIWAYFNFVKSRTYYPRMGMSACGEIRVRNNKQYLIPRITLKNIGKSKVVLNQYGSGFRIWYAREDNVVNAITQLKWFGGDRVFSMFQTHQWIEPGESIFDESSLFALPTNCIAAKVEVRLVAPIGWKIDLNPEKPPEEWFVRRNTVFTCSTVVGPVSEKESETNAGTNVRP